MTRNPKDRGFTLIEVVVALAIVAIGMLAVFKTIGDTVNNVDELRDRSLAEWIADNRITEVRVSGEMPSVRRPRAVDTRAQVAGSRVSQHR
jgi:general secretion pathway protein I